MIPWVDEQCRAWGAHKKWLTYGMHGWPPISQLGRLIIEGPGAGSGSFVSKIPIKDAPESYTAINLALRKMADTHEMEKSWLVLHAHYVFGGHAKNKAPILKVSVPQYWNLLHAGHAFIAACDVPRGADSSRQNISATSSV